MSKESLAELGSLLGSYYEGDIEALQTSGPTIEMAHADKKNNIRTSLIFLLAKQLEDETCQKRNIACKACVGEARTLVPLVWTMIYRLANKVKPASWFREEHVLNAITDIVEELKKDQRADITESTEETVKIVRPPKGLTNG